MRKNHFPEVAVKVLPLLFLLSVSCEKQPVSEAEDDSAIPLSELADIFSKLPLEQAHLEEVYAAVSSSLENGYDEEYTMSDLFKSPGSGVGSDASPDTRAPSRWTRPLRTLLEEYVSESFSTRAGSYGFSTANEFLDELSSSDAQIYWPYSEDWDGTSYPIITFDPGAGMEANIGYEMHKDGSVKQIVVNEQIAMKRPVWVINRNEDSAYETLEMLRRRNPYWGSGGTIVVGPGTRASDDDTKTLVLRYFEASRNYDSWFAGASEFFVKAGALEDFYASTEAEMKLYSPSITDFLVVVKRNQVGRKIPFNAVLVSDWTDQLESVAFMIIEDDGGTRTSWKCSATVKIKSKSYGFDMEIPYNSSDDIVWRGKLSRNYFEKNNEIEGHFGDVYLTFGIE